MATTAPARGYIDVRELWSLPSLYHPVLSHRRDEVAFYWDKSGRIELYILDLKTREVRQLSRGDPPRAPRSCSRATRRATRTTTCTASTPTPARSRVSRMTQRARSTRSSSHPMARGS